MPKLHVQNLGCKVNRIEADSIAAGLVAQGADLVDLAAADVVVINTCTVTSEAAHKARKAVRHALANSNAPKIIVTGCAAAIDFGQLDAIDDRVVVESDKAKAAALAAELLGLATAKADGAQQVRFGQGYRTRPGLKVQDGCDTHCTYCIVPKARGAARSVELGQVLADAEELLGAGARELVISGINLGKYQSQGADLLGLLAELLKLAEQAAPARLRLSSLEPDDISEELVDLLAQNPQRICAHLHLPLQSGSSKILKAMGRPYDADSYMQRVALLQSKIPQIAISTDIIVGFPGESAADFQATVEICRRSGFSRIHTFRFSARAGTAAADMLEQIAPQVKKERATALNKLASELAGVDRQKRDGSIEQVLVVKPGLGLSASYHDVKISATHKVGSLLKMQLAATADGMFGV